MASCHPQVDAYSQLPKSIVHANQGILNICFGALTQLPPQAEKALRVPKPMKLYSRNTDQCGKNIHSTPPPTDQPVRLLDSSPTCVPAPLKNVMSVLVQAALRREPSGYRTSECDCRLLPVNGTVENVVSLLKRVPSNMSRMPNSHAPVW
jgi:hypothetical protein